MPNSQPRVEWIPPGNPHPDSDAALELLDATGAILEDWQEDVFTKSLMERNGKWAAFEVGLVVPRQNGKSELALHRMIAGLFVLREPLIIYTAHLADTSLEMFRRLIEMIEAVPWLEREVAHVWRTNGKEQIELRSGQRVRFRTRTKGGGRGYAGVSCVIFDEAMIFPEASIGSILPVVSRAPNAQLWYLGSAVDQTIHEDGQVLARLRERGVKGNDPSLAYFEWSLPFKTPIEVSAAVAADPESWRSSNPSRMIPEEHIANEHRSMDPRTFAVERLGVGDWPAIGGANAVISLEKWAKLADPDPIPLNPARYAFDATPDRAFATIAKAGIGPDGNTHTEVVERDRGMGWLVPRLIEINPDVLVTDASGPAGSLIPELERAGLKVTPVSAPEYAQACGMFYDGVSEETMRHLDAPEMNAALRGATTRPLVDRWVWSRKNSSVDISPLVASTLALWGHLTTETAAPFLEVW